MSPLPADRIVTIGSRTHAAAVAGQPMGPGALLAAANLTERVVVMVGTSPCLRVVTCSLR